MESTKMDRRKILEQIFVKGKSPQEIKGSEAVIKTLKQGFIPTDKELLEMGWGIAIVFIKADIRISDWDTLSEQLVLAFTRKRFNDVKPFFIGTSIGSPHDLVVLAYVKGIGKDYTEFIKLIRKAIQPLEIVTHPMLWIYRYDPSLSPKL